EMKRASSKTQMSLWKAFESSRLAEGEQDAQLVDHGRRQMYETLQTSNSDVYPFSTLAKSGIKWLWVSKTEAERRIGAQELQDRESEELSTEKCQTRRGMTEASSTKDEMLMWKKGMKDNLQVEDFDFEDGTQEEDEDEDPLGLATNKRTKKGQEEGKEEKKNKWEVESQ
ncbi:unnamed protein product, partial [Symbiodinium sp. CCMP2456]